MATALLIIGALALSAAIVLTFMPLAPSMVFALAGAWAMSRSGYLHVSSTQLLFWLIITAILLVMSRLSGEVVRIDSAGRRFTSIGALAATLVAVALGASEISVVWGPIAGALAGVVFYFRYRHIPLNYNMLRKFMPALWQMVVTYTLAGITLIGLLR